MRANAIEAAEQCGILALPAIDEVAPLPRVLGDWEKTEGSRRLIFCDEGEAGADPISVLSVLRTAPEKSAGELPLPGGERVGVRGRDIETDTPSIPALAVLIGPEGGFAEEERALLRSRPFVTAIPLGPRILRADTAAVAALAVVQAALGDWR
jgi:16S rRNA (uracil1498-N3)-methyltransferase